MAVTTVSNSLILGGWVLTKVLKNGDKKYGSGRVGDNNMLTFLSYCTNKKCHFPIYFYTRLPFH